MKLLLTILLFPIFCNAQSWSYQKQLSRWEKAAKKNLTGAGVRIATLDFGANVINTTEDEVWVLPSGGYDFRNDDADYSEDVSNHGTPGLSQMAGSSIAIAPGAEVFMLKVFNSPVSTTEEIMLEALQWCVDNEIDVVNMSFAYDTPTFDSAVQALSTDHDIVVFAASGNSLTDAQVERPATWPGVYAVNSYPESGDPYHKSITAQVGGHGISLACAGRLYEGIYANGTYGLTTGTSFSSTVAVGFYALYLQSARRNGKNPSRVRVAEYMIKRCVKQSFSNYFGAGYPTF